MHSVKRSTEPGFFAELRAAYTDWDDLDGSARRRIRGTLARDFGKVCAYCEQFCQPTQPRAQIESEETSPQLDEESVDHFRPRHWFPDLWLDWLNLVYACYRCNQAKRGSWPEYYDDVNQKLAAREPRYTPVSEYVNPNASDGKRLAGEFFAFDVETGEMTAGEHLDGEEWSIAHRTIYDIDLNDRHLGENDKGHLWNRRLRQVNMLIQALNTVQDPFRKVRMAHEFTLPDKPFSGFISAYLKQHFPDFG